MSFDPYLYLKDSLNDWPDSLDPPAEARRSYDPRHPERLIELLGSTDEIVSQRGLAIFGELGRKTIGILDAALPHVQHPNIYARSHLLDGVLCYANKLTSAQIRALLPLAEDPKDLICSKMVTVLAAVELDNLIAAVSQLPETESNAAHVAGVQFHVDLGLSAQALFDQSLTEARIESVYILASIERRARVATDFEIPKYTGDSYIHEGLLFQLKRLLRKL